MKITRCYFLMVSLLYMICGTVHAGELNITTSSPVNALVMSLSANSKITLGNGIQACSMIGGRLSQNLGYSSIDTNGRSAVFYLSMQKDSTSGEEVCVGHDPNYKIYKTNVEGIGISFNDADSGSHSRGQSVPLWPQLIKKNTYSGSSIGIGTWVDIRLWKYSSAANALPAGVIEVKGPMIVQVVGPVAGDTLNECSSGKDTAGAMTVCYNAKRIPYFSASIYSSTCEFVNASKTVQMGTHNMHSSTAQGTCTPWVDASFQLRCSNAWGYGADTTDLNNLTKNNTVKVTVHPLDGFSNANQGIIKLDGSGAQGVGVQLAWGDYSTQGTTPGNPVKLDTPTDANTLSSNFAAGPYAIGGNAVSGDGSIKMAARFIRTSGTFSPGQANAKVEILANYQ